MVTSTESMNSPHHSLVWPSPQKAWLECMRPPILPEASYTVHGTPASCKVNAATSPAIPAPTIPMRGAADPMNEDARNLPPSSAPPSAKPVTFSTWRRLTMG